MLIPCIDLLGGKVVQLVQGRKKVLEFDSPEEWIERFASCPLVQLIDLDAAMGTGENRTLVREIARRLPCQVGGGIRSIEAAEVMLTAGARRVICGSTLVRNGEINAAFAEQISLTLGLEKLVFAIDSNRGRVATQGWRQLTNISPVQMMKVLEPWCSALLYTHIDTEGLLRGIPLQTVLHLRKSTSKQLIVGGGISSMEEVERLAAIHVDAVVGMAIYRGHMKIPSNHYRE